MDFGVVGRSPLPKERLRLGTRKIEPQGEESSPQEGRSFSSFRPRSSRRKIGKLPEESASQGARSDTKFEEKVGRSFPFPQPEEAAPQGARSGTKFEERGGRSYPLPQPEESAPQGARSSRKPVTRLLTERTAVLKKLLGLARSRADSQEAVPSCSRRSPVCSLRNGLARWKTEPEGVEPSGKPGRPSRKKQDRAGC